MRNETHVDVGDRRRKRVFIPFIYFLLEVVAIWLVLSLFQVSFNVKSWSIFSMAIFAGVTLYSLSKMLTVYKRQRDYPPA